MADLFPEDLEGDATTEDAELAEVEFEPDEAAFLKATRKLSPIYKDTEASILTGMGWNQCYLAANYGSVPEVDTMTDIGMKSGSFEPALTHLCPEYRPVGQ